LQDISAGKTKWEGDILATLCFVALPLLLHNIFTLKTGLGYRLFLHERTSGRATMKMHMWNSRMKTKIIQNNKYESNSN